MKTTTNGNTQPGLAQLRAAAAEETRSTLADKTQEVERLKLSISGHKQTGQIARKLAQAILSNPASTPEQKEMAKKIMERTKLDVTI